MEIFMSTKFVWATDLIMAILDLYIFDYIYELNTAIEMFVYGVTIRGEVSMSDKKLNSLSFLFDPLPPPPSKLE